MADSVAMRCPDGLTLLTGGARSGKSHMAERLAAAAARPVVFVATAEAGDADMAQRIERHRQDRPSEWATVEEAIELQRALEVADSEAAVIVDCLTLWTSNLFFGEIDETDVLGRCAGAAKAAALRSGPTIVVTNEVGLGLHPPTEIERRYRDLLGRVNREFATHADRTWLVVAGRVVPAVDLEDLT